MLGINCGTIRLAVLCAPQMNEAYKQCDDRLRYALANTCRHRQCEQASHLSDPVRRAGSRGHGAGKVCHGLSPQRGGVVAIAGGPRARLTLYRSAGGQRAGQVDSVERAPQVRSPCPRRQERCAQPDTRPGGGSKGQGHWRLRHRRHLQRWDNTCYYKGLLPPSITLLRCPAFKQ